MRRRAAFAAMPLVAAALVCAGWALRTVDAGIPPVQVDPAAAPARLISEYHLFTDPARQQPNAGLIPYDIQTPLFSDYAAKHRFVYVPDGTSAQYRNEGPFEFPVGTVLVKTFGFLNDLRAPALGERIIETRLLIRKADGTWTGLPYLWNEDATEARLAVAGAVVPVEWTHTDGSRRAIDYIVPNMNQCKQCHENAKQLIPIGPAARYLNKDYDYGDAMENQLARWIRLGILEGAPEDPAAAPKVPHAFDPDSGTLAARARAYLDINCAHCHNPDGPAYTSGLDLSWGQDDPARYGVNKPPVAAGRGAGDLRFGIVPGDPAASILHFRIASTDPGIMMPPLPRRVADEEGVALIGAWIASMAGNPVD